MKRSFLALLLTGVLMLAGVALAAPAPKPTATPKASPSPAPVPQKVKTLWDYKAELGLTDDQSDKIKSEVKNLQTKLQESKGKLEGLQKELNGMVESGSVEDIRAKLQEIANIQIDMRIVDIQTARAINKILTPEQLTRWRDIQKKNRKG